jgi:hypothetical protein
MLITYALGTIDGTSLEMVNGRCEFYDEERAPREARDYGNVFLGEMWVETSHAVAKLDELRRGVGSVQEDRRVQTIFDSLSTATRMVLPTKTVSRWSEWVAMFRETSRRGAHVRGLHEPLVRKGLPPFSRALYGILDWVWHGVDGGNTLLDQLVVILPDRRARIVDITWDRTDLLARVEGSLLGPDLEIQCRLETVTGADILPAQTTADGTVRWEIPPTTTKAELYLLDSSSRLIASGEFTNTGGTTTTDLTSLTPQQLAEEDISGGESEVVEFKPFFGDTAKGHEIAETVIAFANSKGGRLYIGVDDNGVPNGLAAMGKGVGKNRDPKDWPQLMEEKLSAAVRNLVKPVPRLEIKWVAVGGEPVLVVKVNPGDDRPYSTHENFIYVRKGASCRAPEPKTELRQLFGEQVPESWIKV